MKIPKNHPCKLRREEKFSELRVFNAGFLGDYGLMVVFLLFCLAACTQQDPALPAPSEDIETLASDSFFKEVVGVTPQREFQSLPLNGPTLFYSEQACEFDGGFRGRGEMWYVAVPGGEWQRVPDDIEWPEDSGQPVTNGELLEEWWVVTAIPEEGAGFVFQCADGEAEEEAPREEQQVTTEGDIAPNPELPHRWHPFDQWPSDEPYAPYENEDDLDLSGPLPAGCPTRVHSFNLYLAGQVRGNLSFNQRKRGGPKYAHAMNGGNTTLGGFENIPNRIMSWKGYKYQVEIRFLGPLQHAFFGQMASDPQAWSFTDPEFHDDSPANDWVGKNWNLLPGEKKSDFPVIEIVSLTNTDHIVRYIDAPGGGEVMGIGLSDKYMYFIIYAGACGVVTDIKYLQIYYPDQFVWTNGTPIATEMTLTGFQNAVGNWSFEE
jgi:hypothetical protein